MTDLDERTPQSKAQIDTAAWLFAILTIGIIGVAVVATYLGQ